MSAPARWTLREAAESVKGLPRIDVGAVLAELFANAASDNYRVDVASCYDFVYGGLSYRQIAGDRKMNVPALHPRLKRVACGVVRRFRGDAATAPYPRHPSPYQLLALAAPTSTARPDDREARRRLVPPPKPDEAESLIASLRLRVDRLEEHNRDLRERLAAVRAALGPARAPIAGEP